MRPTSHRRFAVALFAALAAVALLAVATAPTQAARLEASRCTEIASEREALLATGVREQMAKGPGWARDNLPRATLDRIARLIDLDEQLTFRCPLKFSTSPLKPAAPENAAEDEEAAVKPSEANAATPAGTAPAADTARRASRGTKGIPLPVRRPAGPDGNAGPPAAMRGSLAAPADGSSAPDWANTSMRNR